MNPYLIIALVASILAFAGGVMLAKSVKDELSAIHLRLSKIESAIRSKMP